MTSIDKFLAKTKKIRLLTYASRWMEINLSNKKATINMEYFGFDPPITTFKHVKFSTLNERSRICCCCTKKYIMLIRMVFKRNKQNILALGVRKHIPKRILKMYIRIHSRETGVMHMRKFYIHQQNNNKNIVAVDFNIYTLPMSIPKSFILENWHFIHNSISMRYRQ